MGGVCAQGAVVALLDAFGGPWSLASVLGVVCAAAMAAWWCSPPLSNCAFCAPFWQLTYSVPMALLVGKQTAKQAYLAFAPVPDLPLQLPIVIVMLVVFGVDG